MAKNITAVRVDVGEVALGADEPSKVGTEHAIAIHKNKLDDL